MGSSNNLVHGCQFWVEIAPYTVDSYLSKNSFSFFWKIKWEKNFKYPLNVLITIIKLEIDFNSNASTRMTKKKRRNNCNSTKKFPIEWTLYLRFTGFLNGNQIENWSFDWPTESNELFIHVINFELRHNLPSSHSFT